MRSLSVLTCAAVLAAASAAAAYGFGGLGFDFGLFRDNQLDAHSEQLFGIESPVPASSTESVGATDANADPTSLITVAKGLRVHVLTAQPNAAPNLDQMVFWPNDENPTHLIVANEEGPAQRGLQRIRLSDGLVETILSGTSAGDPVRRTPWGTIIFGEENGSDGWLLEIADPLHTTNVTFNRNAGTSSDPAHVATRPAMGWVQFLMLGSADFAMMDNIAYDPGHGNFVINEDGDSPEVGRNNDIWSYLDDGDDADDQSDGCVRVATLNDLTAESTGGLFDQWGTHYYVSIQHNVTGHGVVLDITGWH